MFRKSLFISSITFFCLHLPLSADPLVYVVSAGLTGSGQIGTVDLNTGAYQTYGPTEPDGYFGLATGPNGTLVAGTYAGNLDSINPATGVPTQVGPTGLASCLGPVDPSCGSDSYSTLGGLGTKVYATNFGNDLYTVNPATGAATLLNSNTGIPAIPFVPASLNSDGTINFYDEAIWASAGKLYATFDAFAVDPNTFAVTDIDIAPELYRINPVTGLATVIGPTDLGIGAVADVNGVSYVLNDLTDQISTIDLATGQTTFVTNFDPAAGVIQGAVAATPEPGNFAPAAIGLAVVGLWRRRFRLRTLTDSPRQPGAD